MSLNLVDYKRVFLLILGVLYAGAQVIKVTQVFLPSLIYSVEQNSLLELLNHSLALSLVGLLEVYRYVIHHLAVSERNNDALIHLTLLLINVLNYRIGYLGSALTLAREALIYLVIYLVCKLLYLGLAHHLLREGYIHGKLAHKGEP